MKFKHYIFCLLLIAFSTSTFGQKNSKFSSSQSDADLVKEAQAIHEKNPSEAIALLERVIQQKRKKKKRNQKVEADAYTLLGNIYQNINQYELALQRYNQAMKVWQRSKAAHPKPESELYYRIGKVHLQLKNDKEAESNFKTCLRISKDKNLQQLCEEGLADVELLRGNVEESLSQIDKVEANYKIDSLAKARLEAKRSQNYSQQSDYSNAYESLKNSVDNLPKDKKVSKKEYEEIKKAKDEIVKIPTASNAEKIEATTNTGTLDSRVKIEAPTEIAVRENLQIASLYEKLNNLPEAERFVKISKDAIDKNTSAASVAEVYKKSSDINRKRGEVDAALVDMEKYIEAKENAIRDLEEELKQQIEIVKGQQRIDIVEKDNNIAEKDRELLTSQLSTQKAIIGLLSLLLGASFIFFYFLNKNVKAKRKANQLLLLKSLRTQMNPHFIFNALNSVNNFIAKNDEKAANKFLSEFSRLMRKVLDHSQKDLISFEEEMELNELYLKLEHFRFRDRFEYQFDKNIDTKIYDMEIPPMLIQPFIENAVWHGLRYKEGKGKLLVSVDKIDNNLIVTIKDNGIGRTKSKELKTTNQKKYKSTGLENVSKRIAMINEIYKKNYELKVEDAYPKKEDTGTLVTIKIPAQN